jgi:hypothetical protein
MIQLSLNRRTAWKLVHALCVLTLTLLASCNPTELTPKNAKSSVMANDGSLTGMAYVYEDSPYVLGGPNYGPRNVSMASFLNPIAKLITPNNSLTGNCTMNFYGPGVTINDCVRSLSKASASTQPLPRKADGTYIFPTDSSEFYQVNSLYHVNLANKVFHEKLNFAYQQAMTLDLYGEPKSIPSYLMGSKLFWFKAMSSIDKKIFNFDYLTTYSQCDLEGNASFNPTGPTLCFGGLKNYPGFYFIQDPSIIYHELGHAYIALMMNLRNGVNSTNYHPLRSNLGGLGYDEAGSIGEGVADYFSYMMNKRERIGEFALGKIAKQARPLTESDDLHRIPGIEETAEGRLSYPQFLLYDPNNPDVIFEDVHYAGQIVSHYLVALTKELKTSCSLTTQQDGGHDQATSMVLLLLSETLSELGDLNARGVDGYNGAGNFSIPLTGADNFFVNLDDTNSFLWSQFNNPVTYRRFFQTFAKNINKYISFYNPPVTIRQGLCPLFTKDKSEKLLDDYGLLLFKTYNDNGNSTKNRNTNIKDVVSQYATPTLTPVSENNRRKSVLVSKELIELSTRTTENPDRVGFYIIDNGTDMEAVLKELLYKGFTVPTSPNVSGTIYNNNNIRISPGEILGLIPNLLNNSNSTMAGVQLLATDWDHVHITETQTGHFKPCVIDSMTTEEQGGEKNGTCTSTETNYNRLIKNTSTNSFPLSAAAPVCMVLSEEGETSKWVSQNEYRKKQGLSLLDKDCLGYSTSAVSDQDFTFNPHECLVRFLPGANEAFYSKIEPQKSYYESVAKISEEGNFNIGNVLLLEVNKWIPPGTKFRCRLRARFSNCSDCYTDGNFSNDDFIDSDYNGHKPFKVINFDFEIND